MVTSSDESTEELESFMLHSSASDDESEMEMESFLCEGQSEDESVEDVALQKSATSVLPSSTDSPLYEGSEITCFESHLLLFQFAVRHSLSSKAFGELLQVVSAHLPQTAKSPKSVYMLKRFFSKIYPDLSTRAHKYCSCCLKLLEEGSTPCDGDKCVSAGAKIETFYTMPLKSQLKKKMQGMYYL